MPPVEMVLASNKGIFVAYDITAWGLSPLVPEPEIKAQVVCGTCSMEWVV